MYIVTPVYKGHSRDPEIVPFVSSCPLYTGQNYIHCSLIRKKRPLFIDSDMWTKQVIPFVYGKKYSHSLTRWKKKKNTPKHVTKITGTTTIIFIQYIDCETCLNQTLNTMKSCIYWTLNKVLCLFNRYKPSTVYSKHRCWSQQASTLTFVRYQWKLTSDK
jgi:hypothetical protein